MMPYEKKLRKNWPQIRQQGSRHFILKYGLLNCGAIYGMFAYVLTQAWKFSFFQQITIFLAGMILFGPLMGWFTWRWLEDDLHRRETANNKRKGNLRNE